MFKTKFTNINFPHTQISSFDQLNLLLNVSLIIDNVYTHIRDTRRLSPVPTYLCDPADLAFVSRAVAGSRQRALLNRSSTVQGDEGGSAQVKWIVGVVVQLVCVCQGLLTGSQNFASLNCKGRFNMMLRDKKRKYVFPFEVVICKIWTKTNQACFGEFYLVYVEFESSVLMRQLSSFCKKRGT